MKRGVIVASIAGLANAILHSEYRRVCSQIEAAISDASDVYYPRRLLFSFIDIQCSLDAFTVQYNYEQDVKHWMTSSADRAGCSVQPGTADDVSVIVRAFRYFFCRGPSIYVMT
jgi:hypothetical protein